MRVILQMEGLVVEYRLPGWKRETKPALKGLNFSVHARPLCTWYSAGSS